MLTIVRSDSVNKANFKKGDKFVCANILADGVIEYVVNRPVYSYCIKSIQTNKYVKRSPKEKEHKLCDLPNEATYFKTYKAAKDFMYREFGQEGITSLMLTIMESVE